MKLKNIFETEQEAIEAQAYDYEKYINSSKHAHASNEWKKLTVCWSEIKQRITDGKWFYDVCPYSDRTYSTELYDRSWEPIENEGQ